MLTLVRNVASSAGISVVIANLTSMTRRSTASSPSTSRRSTTRCSSPDVTRWLDLATDQGRALADQMITLQAAIMAYANDFMLLTAICVLSIPFVFAIGSTASLRGEGGGVRSARDVSTPTSREEPARARRLDDGPSRPVTSPFEARCGDALRMRLTKLLPHLLGMLAERRHRAHSCAPRSRIGAGAGYDTGPLGVSTLMRRRCGCAIRPATSLTRANAMSAAASFSDSVVDIHRGERGRDLAVGFGAVLHAARSRWRNSDRRRAPHRPSLSRRECAIRGRSGSRSGCRRRRAS